MAIYRGEGGKTDVVPDSGDYEFAGSIIVEKDAYVGGDLHVEGDINGNFTGNGSGLENVPTPFLQADDCIYLNNQVITNDYTMPVGKNGMTAGDITVNGSVTIPDGSDWHIIGNDDGLVTLESLGIPNHDLVTVTSDGDIVNVTSLSVDGNITSSTGIFTGDGSGLYNVPMGDTYTKNEIDAQQQIQDEQIQNNSEAIQTNADAIQANTDAINAIPGAVDSYTKAEIDAQQDAQDTEINKKANTTDVDAKNVTQDAEIDTKIGDAPVDGEQYVRKDGVWAELAAADGGIADAPADGKTYGRKDLKWEEVVADGYTEAETDALLNDKADKSDTYTKSEVDAQQLLQDAEITANTTDIATNTADIAENKTNIQQNTTDIETLMDDVDALTGSVIYKGSLNATVTSAPADAVVGDMYINEYNVSEPATNYPVASGWSPVTEVKYDDKLIKTDAGWDKIASVVGVPTYTAGEIDDLLDDKADKGDSYLKAESDATNEAQDALIQANTDAIDALPTPVDTYTKDEIDASQNLQDIEIAKKQDTGVSYTKTESDTLLDAKADKSTTYTKTEVDASQALQNAELDTKADVGDSYTKAESDIALNLKANQDTTYTKTEVDDSQALQNTEIAKKANQATTYTKDEVDSLLESASGAIVGNYTNKHASGGVARDPLAGNLYLSSGMSFSTDYNSVTSIYISDTDGDGDVRDFDEVQVSDKITLTSENGSGEYTIVTISDVGGYRELVVSTDSATGTIANDTPVSIVLDVASSGETGGGIEEAPADGKQYARQDEAWTEVEATSGGGGGVEAQPPVAFNLAMTSNLNVANATETDVPFDNAIIDTDNGLTGNTYVVKKAGLYDLSYSSQVSKTNDIVWLQTYLKINGTAVTNNNSNYDNNTNVTYVSQSNSKVVDLKVGDIISLSVKVATTSTGSSSLQPVGTFLSGHMVSSITEGEVKEKEAIAFKGELSADQTVTTATWTKVELDNATIDTDSALVDGKFQPSVAGYYQVTGSICANCSPDSTDTASRLYKNGSIVTQGNQVTSENVARGNVSDVVYLNGSTDYLELYGRVKSSGTCKIRANDDGTANSGYSTFLSAHLITGQSSGGGSGEATGTPSSFARIVDEKPQNTHGGTAVVGNQDRTLNKIEYDPDNIVTLSNDKEFTLQAGTYVINFSAPAYRTEQHNASLFSVTDNKKVLQGTAEYSVSSSSTASTHSIGRYSVTLTAPHTYKIQHYTRNEATTDGLGIQAISGDSVFTTVDIQKVGTGGASSGGGSYTPEKMVWEDKTSERELGTEYTNTNDVPLYMQPLLKTADVDGFAQLFIDGQLQSTVGNGSAVNGLYFNSPLFIIPAGSKYKLIPSNNTSLDKWSEARMPVAVGTGGKTVAFELGLSSDITTTPHGVWTQCALNNAITDTDSGADLSNNSYVVKTAGVYSLAFNHQVSNSTESLTKHYGRFEVNGTDVAYASSTGLSGNGNHPLSGSCVVNLNVGDVLTLHSYVSYSSGDCKQLSAGTRLMGNLVTSHSASGGDSIWKDVDGDAVLETKDKKLTIDANVGELGQRARIMTDTGQLDINVGAGGLPDVTITDGKLGIGTSSPTTSLNVSNDGTSYPVFDGYETQQVSNSQVAYTKWIQSGGIASHFGVDTEKGIMGTFSNHPLEIRTNNVGRMTIANDGKVNMNAGLGLTNLPTAGTPSNLYVSPAGTVHLSTATSYSTEEVDKKLAIKDKLIEKLSARLDELEKRMK